MTGLQLGNLYNVLADLAMGVMGKALDGDSDSKQSKTKLYHVFISTRLERAEHATVMLQLKRSTWLTTPPHCSHFTGVTSHEVTLTAVRQSRYRKHLSTSNTIRMINALSPQL